MKLQTSTGDPLSSRSKRKTGRHGTNGEGHDTKIKGGAIAEPERRKDHSIPSESFSVYTSFASRSIEGFVSTRVSPVGGRNRAEQRTETNHFTQRTSYPRLEERIDLENFPFARFEAACT